MSTCIDGFVIPLPTEKIDEYRLISEKAGAIWREHGAFDYCDCKRMAYGGFKVLVHA